MRTGLTLEEAQQALCEDIDCLGTEKLPLAEASGRRRAEAGGGDHRAHGSAAL